jgi:hypothetical protein
LQEARRETWGPLKQLASILTARTRSDLAERAAHGVSDKDLLRFVASRTRLLMQRLAEDAHQRLIRRRDADYLSVALAADFPERFAMLFEQDLTTMRGFRICEAATNVLIRNAAERDPGSKAERRDLPGFTGDQLHAMAGAGYCDVFTCDWETLKWVGPIRKDLGLPEPLSLKNHPGGASGFVKALTAT